MLWDGRRGVDFVRSGTILHNMIYGSCRDGHESERHVMASDVVARGLILDENGCKNHFNWI